MFQQLYKISTVIAHICKCQIWGKVFKKLCGRAVFNSNGLALPGEENGNPLQYSCLENSTDRGAWQAIVHTVHGVAKTH